MCAIVDIGREGAAVGKVRACLQVKECELKTASEKFWVKESRHR